MADLENSVPATPQTLYRLASVSKPITAVAALQLWQAGKLDLDAPVQKFCPAFPVKEDGAINTRELLSHMAGIRHYHLGKALDPLVGSTKHLKDPIKEGLDFFKNDPLVAKPGTEFHYSTYGYTLIGCAIEGASDKKYVDYVMARIPPFRTTQSVAGTRAANSCMESSLRTPELCVPAKTFSGPFSEADSSI